MNYNKNKNRKIYLSTTLWFGKYKGTTVYNVILNDVSYMDWFNAYINNDWDDKVKLMFDEFWERKNLKVYGFRNDKKK